MVQQQGGIKVPETRAEIDALAARRSELQGQLRGLEERRFNLNSQLERTGSEGRAPLNQRLAWLDSRITSVERQLAQLDDAITTGLANAAIHTEPGVPTPFVPAVPPVPSFDPVIMVPPRDGTVPVDMRKVVAGGLVSLSLVLLLAWLAFRAGLRRMARAAAASDPAQISQLQQSIDAIALEVERISENQRYVTRLINQQTPELIAAARPEERVPAKVRRDE